MLRGSSPVTEVARRIDSLCTGAERTRAYCTTAKKWMDAEENIHFGLAKAVALLDGLLRTDAANRDAQALRRDAYEKAASREKRSDAARTTSARLNDVDRKTFERFLNAAAWADRYACASLDFQSDGIAETLIVGFSLPPLLMAGAAAVFVVIPGMPLDLSASFLGWSGRFLPVPCAVLGVHVGWHLLSPWGGTR